MSDQIFIYKTYNEQHIQELRNSGIQLVLGEKAPGQREDLLNLKFGSMYLGSSYIHYHRNSEVISPEKEDLVLISGPSNEQKQICEQKGCLLIDTNQMKYVELIILYRIGSKQVSGFKYVRLEKMSGATAAPPLKPLPKEQPVPVPPVKEEPVIIDAINEGASNAVVDVQEPDKDTP